MERSLRLGLALVAVLTIVAVGLAREGLARLSWLLGSAGDCEAQGKGWASAAGGHAPAGCPLSDAGRMLEA